MNSATQMVSIILNNDTKTLVKRYTGFTYKPKLKRLTQSNNYFDLTTQQAVSYDWWVYFRIIDGVPVFNNYSYSISTTRHQYRMRDLLYKLGYSNFIIINTESSLKEFTLAKVEQQLKTELQEQQNELAKCKRAISKKREDIQFKIESIQDMLGQLVNVYRHK